MAIEELVQNTGETMLTDLKVLKLIQKHLDSGKISGGSFEFVMGEDYWEILVKLDIAKRVESELSEDEEDYLSEIVDPRVSMDRSPANWSAQLSDRNKKLTLDNYSGSIFVINEV